MLLTDEGWDILPFAELMRVLLHHYAFLNTAFALCHNVLFALLAMVSASDALSPVLSFPFLVVLGVLLVLLDIFLRLLLFWTLGFKAWIPPVSGLPHFG